MYLQYEISIKTFLFYLGLLNPSLELFGEDLYKVAQIQALQSLGLLQ
jgi:hypothetical protein